MATGWGRVDCVGARKSKRARGPRTRRFPEGIPYRGMDLNRSVSVAPSSSSSHGWTPAVRTVGIALLGALQLHGDGIAERTDRLAAIHHVAPFAQAPALTAPAAPAFDWAATSTSTGGNGSYIVLPADGPFRLTGI